MTQDPTESDLMETTPAAEQPTPAPEAPETAPAQAEPARKSRWGAFLLDTTLVLALLGVIGGGAWYVQQELHSYSVPTPMELAQAEHLELCKQHEQLQPLAYKADEQLHMIERLSQLEKQLADVRNQLSSHKSAISSEHRRVLNMQKEIRQEDKTSRSVAKSLLIGLPIGNATRSNGKIYQHAIIHRLEGKRISLRTATGPVTFPLSELNKDNLPDIARYALGLDDLVDMSDFEAAPGTPAPRKKRKGKLITPKLTSPQPAAPGYEANTGVPVVDTQAPTPINIEPGLMPEDDGSWKAPAGDLPISE